MKALLIVVAVVALCGACKPPSSQSNERTRGVDSAPAEGARMIAVAPGDAPVDVLVSRTVAATTRRVLVYVGASWCEPCVHFHKAVVQGRMDAHFPNLDFLEFNLDRDAGRLKAAGYQSSLIPLFALPLPDGKASKRFIQGSIKGDGAVDNIVMRLKNLLDNSLRTSL